MIQFLPAIILLGIITTYEDIKEGKIRNKWIISALFYSIVMNIVLIIGAKSINMHYVYELFTNLIFAITIGFGLWHLGIWTSGDGKLFIAFAALIPLSYYAFGYIEWIPSLTLLINVFVPAALIFTIALFRKVRSENILKTLKSAIIRIFDPKRLIISFIQFFAIIWLVKTALNAIGLSQITFIATLGVFYLMGSYLKGKAIYLVFVVAALRILFDPLALTPNALFQTITFVLIWRSIKSLYKSSIMELGYEVFSKDVAIKDLKPGMILADCITQKNKLSKEERNDLSTIPNIEILSTKGRHYIKTQKGANQSFFEDSPEGITKSQIIQIKRTGFRSVRISSHIPFAPFMFAGTLLTLLAKGNILIFIINLLRFGG